MLTVLCPLQHTQRAATACVASYVISHNCDCARPVNDTRLNFAAANGQLRDVLRAALEWEPLV